MTADLRRWWPPSPCWAAAARSAPTRLVACRCAKLLEVTVRRPAPGPPCAWLPSTSRLPPTTTWTSSAVRSLRDDRRACRVRCRRFIRRSRRCSCQDEAHVGRQRPKLGTASRMSRADETATSISASFVPCRTSQGRESLVLSAHQLVDKRLVPFQWSRALHHQGYRCPRARQIFLRQVTQGSNKSFHSRVRGSQLRAAN